MKINIVVPTGNFGNFSQLSTLWKWDFLSTGLFVHQMTIMFFDLLIQEHMIKTGVKRTISPSMDILISAIERLFI